MIASQHYSKEVRTAAELLMMHRSGAIALYEHNRAVKASLVRRLADDIARDRTLGPNDVHIAEVGERRFVIDGQHRLAALGLLEPEQLEGLEVFLCINQGTPVPPAYYNAEVARVLGAAVRALAAKYPRAVAEPGASFRRPKFAEQPLLDELSESHHVREAIAGGRLDAERLVGLIEALNADKRSYLEHCEDEGLQADVPATCVGGAVRSGFYVALERNWTSLLIHRVAQLLTDAE